MIEPTDLDKLVALRILIEALQIEGEVGPPEEQGWSHEPAAVGQN